MILYKCAALSYARTSRVMYDDVMILIRGSYYVTVALL